jgi:hypothetical protein
MRSARVDNSPAFFVYVRKTLCNSKLHPVDLESERKYSINIVGAINRLTFHATNIGNQRTLLRQFLDEENNDHKNDNSDS